MRLFCSISSSVTAEDAAAMVKMYGFCNESFGLEDESFPDDDEDDERSDTSSLDYLKAKWRLQQRVNKSKRSKSGGD